MIAYLPVFVNHCFCSGLLLPAFSLTYSRAPAGEERLTGRGPGFLSLIHPFISPEEESHRAGTGMASDGRADRINLHISWQIRELLFDKSRHRPGIIYALWMADVTFSIVFSYTAKAVFIYGKSKTKIINIEINIFPFFIITS